MPNQFLADHTVRGAGVLPGAFFVARALATGSGLQDVRFESLHTLDSTAGEVLPVLGTTGDAIVMTAVDGGARIASARLLGGGTGPADPFAGEVAPSADEAAERVDGATWYARLARQGNDYGERFRRIDSLERSASGSRANWSPSADASDEERFVTLLDACTHAAAFAAELQSTYYLHAIGRILARADAALADGPRILHVTVLERGADGCTVNSRVTDGEGRTLIIVDGLELRRFGDAAADGERLAVAGTFTLDPLDDVVAFWSRQIGTPVALARADYGQVFQALLSAETAFDETAASHTALVRVADWAPRRTAPALPSRDALDATLSGFSRHLLPDGRTVASLNKYETAYLYQEIYRDLAYRRHGVRVLEGDTVIDIGANIGLFTLFASGEAPDVRVISVEPSPVVLPILKANAALYAPGGSVVAAGASDAPGTATFTAYRNSSVFSSFAADEGADEEAIRQVIRNSLEAMGQEDEALLEEAVEEMIQGRMDAESFECELVSVSDIIREHGLERIDLLKIDAEKSEDAILAGIAEEHWPLIDQLIIEVHLQGGRSDAHIVALLEGHGFEVIRDEEELLSDSGLIGLYAARPARFARNAAAGEERALRESADLFVEATRTHASRSGVPLEVVLCPADVRDPSVRELHRSVAEDIATRLADIPATRVFAWDEWAGHYPVEHAHDTLGGALADMPYTTEWYVATASALVRRHVASRRPAAKVAVLDCDNTLWGGVVGEDGVSGIRIEPAHVALHASIRRLIERGVLFVLASKNAEADVRAVFDERADFPFEWSDVVAHRVNWQPKAENLVSLAAELELGLDAFVFLDDSPLECEEMRLHLPEVLTLRMPEEPASFARFVDHVWSFDQNVITAEDERRAAMYREESRRRAYREDAGSIAGFIEGLQLEVSFAPLDEASLVRASQMTQRTNQFNFTTRRRGVDELREWLTAEGHDGAVVHVVDRFGDYGVTGLVLYGPVGDVLEVDTFLLSCRVLGRGVEHRIIAHLGALAGGRNLSAVRLRHSPTPKNEPARRFLAQLPGARETEGDDTVLLLGQSDASALEHEPASLVAASDAVAEGAAKRPQLPPAPSSHVERIAREFSSAALIAEAVESRARVPRPALDVDHVAPRNAREEGVAAIWEDLLGLDGIGVDDDFFALGGTSLGAVQMVAQVQRKLSLSVSVVDVFEAPTVAGLAKAADGDSTGAVAGSRERGAARRAQRPTRRGRGA